MTDDPARISVSRDALRADLAEMELRLRIYFDDQLLHKADMADYIELRNDIKDLESRQSARERGEFTPAQERAIDSRLRAATGQEWTWRQQAATVVSAAATSVALIITVLLALHGVVI